MKIKRKQTNGKSTKARAANHSAKHVKYIKKDTKANKSVDVIQKHAKKTFKKI